MCGVKIGKSICSKMHANSNEGETRNYQLILCARLVENDLIGNIKTKNTYKVVCIYTHDIAPEHPVSIVSSHMEV